MVTNFLAAFQRCEINKDKEDRWEWKGNIDKKYNVKYAYNMIWEGDAVGCENAFQILWKMKGQPSSILCSWRVLHNKFSTKDRLIELGIPNVNPLSVMCNIGEENVSHMFFMCRSV